MSAEKIKVQVHFHRELTTEQGQKILREIAEEIKAKPSPGGWVPLGDRIVGVRRENLFPVWAQKVLVDSKFEWEEINLCYQIDVPDMQSAKKMIAWFDGQIRPWAKARNLPDVEKLHIRVHDRDDMTVGMDAF